MKKLLILIAILFLPTFSSAKDFFDGATYQVLEYKDYKFYIYENSDWFSSTLHVHKDNKIILVHHDSKLKIGLFNKQSPEYQLVNGVQDITGDAIPEVVVSTWSGGAHCCSKFLVFSLGDELGMLWDFNVKDASESYFKDFNDDGILEFVTWDHTFAYWHVSFGGSPAPEVILKFENGKYVLAWEWMKKPLASRDDMKKKFGYDQETRESLCDYKQGWTENSDFVHTYDWKNNPMMTLEPPEKKNEGFCFLAEHWSIMLEYIYTGHPQEAWAYLDSSWPGSEEAKQKFIKDFKEQLLKSEYLDQLRF